MNDKYVDLVQSNKEAISLEHLYILNNNIDFFSIIDVVFHNKKITKDNIDFNDYTRAFLFKNFFDELTYSDKKNFFRL